jgi:hypothetical protein
MSDPFAETIASWTNFYMLTGSAAATLVGLIFVSVSLHIDFIASAKKDSELSAMARLTFGNFLLILSFAFIFMVPSDTPMGIGVPLLILGLWMLARTGRLWLTFGRNRRSEGRIFASNQVLREYLIPGTVCYMVVVFVALEILQGNTYNLGWMVLVIIWLLISATRSAWDLMLQVAEMKKAKEQQKQG